MFSKLFKPKADIVKAEIFKREGELLERQRKKILPKGDFNRAINNTDGLAEFLLKHLDTTKHHGHSRTVFVFDEVAIKIAHQYEGLGCIKGIAANVQEYELWHNTYSKPFNRFLCPVVGISDCCRYLAMQACQPLPDTLDFHFQLPHDSIFTDLKLSNLGLLDGKVVILDYGMMDLLVRPFLTSTYALKNGKLTLLDTDTL